MPLYHPRLDSPAELEAEVDRKADEQTRLMKDYLETDAAERRQAFMAFQKAPAASGALADKYRLQSTDLQATHPAQWSDFNTACKDVCTVTITY